MKNIELIIFDMDGLMFDTERMSFKAWKKAGSKYGYEIDDEVLKKIVGSNMERARKIYLQHLGEECPIDEIAKEKFKIMEELLESNGVPVKDGLYDILSYLKRLNLKKAVATTTRRERATRLIKMANIETYFDYIVCGDEVEKCKPDPDIFLKAAGKLGCNPGNCLVLEDSRVGVQAAYNAGMMPVMIPDIIEPDEEIQRLIYRRLGNLREVKSLLEGIEVKEQVV